MAAGKLGGRCPIPQVDNIFSWKHRPFNRMASVETLSITITGFLNMRPLSDIRIKDSRDKHLAAMQSVYGDVSDGLEPEFTEVKAR